MPGITYIREQRDVGGARVVFHIVIGPQLGGLYSLRPVLSNGLVSGTETVSSMQRRLMPRANVVGVNGDLFRWDTGQPTGVFVHRGVLASRPNRGRSSLGIGLDGLLYIERLSYGGIFQLGSAPVHTLHEFNRPLFARNGFTLFVPSWGARTPVRRETKEAILTDVQRTFPNRDRSARVVKLVRGSGHAIPAGGAILQARGSARSLLRAEARRGVPMTFRLGVRNWWDNVNAALGGGPLLVNGGVAVYRPDSEWFTSDQLDQRHPRTAVGQLADGRILLLVADGRSTASRGLTMAQLANAMVRYGAERAMALDGGGSSELAFNGRVLNVPSDGHERSVAESLQLAYIGAYARKPRYPTYSPNGDGYQDVQRLYARFVRKTNVHLELVRPDGVVAWQREALRKPGTMTKDLRGSRMEGAWRWIVSGVDLEGRSSRMGRRFRVNNTLGFLTLSTTRMKVRRGRGGRLRIGFKLAQRADVSVTIRRGDDTVVRKLTKQNDLAPGAYAVIWNGRNDAGRVVRSGTFFADVRGTNGLGTATLRKKFVVRRVS